jgi:hypothetical protein
VTLFNSQSNETSFKEIVNDTASGRPSAFLCMVLKHGVSSFTVTSIPSSEVFYTTVLAKIIENTNALNTSSGKI